MPRKYGLSTLRGQIEYIESHQPDIIITTCKMYRKRHIFEGDDGKLYLLTKIAGWDTFSNVQAALDAINGNPGRYLIAGGD